MGIASKTTRTAKLRRGPTKFQKTRRIVRIHKKVQRRTAERALRQQKKSAFIKKRNQRAENEVIEVIQPAFNDQPQQGEVSIMDLLNETQTNPIFDNLNEQLDLKLRQIDQDNLDNPEVRRVYTAIGKILSTYRSGKIPKAFKIVPNLQRWQEILSLTSPQKWTPQAMFQAVNLFASNLDVDRASIFYSTILLPAVRQNLRKGKKLNYHYFQALRKALYKPNAWFKSILFGLETSESTSTPREVQIIEAVLKQNSIPMLNSAAAMMLLMELPTNTSRIHYIKTLIEKQYVLGKKVVDSLYFYFLGFENSESALPVVWHQAVLSFCMFYGSNFGEMEKAALRELVTKHKHHVITAEILKHL